MPHYAGVDVNLQADYCIISKFPRFNGARNHREGLLVADPVYKAFLEELKAGLKVTIAYILLYSCLY